MRKTDVLKDAQDFIVIGQSGRDRYVYAAKPSLKKQEQLYELSVSAPEDRNIEVFNRYWEFDEQKGIRGSSTWLALRFDKRALRPNGLWLPGLSLEAKTLDKQGKLENGVYRDYGNVVYSNEQPNKEVAEILVLQAEKLGLQLPLIVPFRAMDYVPENRILKPFFVQNPQGIIQGQEAQNKISSLNYKGISDVQRLVRDWDGGWGAY